MIWILNNDQKLDYSNYVDDIIAELKINSEKIKFLTYGIETINELTQKSLINEFELFIIKECSFLSSKQLNNDTKELIDFINNDNCNYILISNKKNNINEFKNAKIINIEQLNNKNKKKYIIEYLKKNNIKLDEQVIESLVLKTNNDKGVIQNEIKKIELLNKSNVSTKEIINIISNYNNENVFDLLESIINKTFSKTIKIIDNLKETKQDEIITISSLAYQINQLLLFKKLEKKYTINEIINILNIQQFIAIKLKNLSSKISEIELIKIIDKLFELEINIKTMKIEKDIGLKVFILNVNRE